VVDHVIEVVAPRIETATAMFVSARGSFHGNAAAQSMLVDGMAKVLVRSLLLDADVRRFVPFVLRGLFQPSAHFEHFFDAVPGRLHALLSRLVGLIRGEPAESETVILQTHALIGQLIVFLVGRPILLRRMHWQEYSPEAVEKILAVLVPSLQRTLGLPVVSIHVTPDPAKASAAPDQ